MRALVALVVIVGLLVGGDALVRSIAERRVEEQVVRELGGDAEVDVALGGFPFTVSALGGRIPSATVSGTGIRRGPLTLDSFQMSMTDVELSLAESSALIERGSGTARIDLGSLADFIGRRTQLGSISFGDGEISARIPRLGRRISAPIRLEGGRLIIDVPVARSIGVRLPKLFRGLSYTALEITANAAVLRFKLEDGVLEAAAYDRQSRQIPKISTV